MDAESELLELRPRLEELERSLIEKLLPRNPTDAASAALLEVRAAAGDRSLFGFTHTHTHNTPHMPRPVPFFALRVLAVRMCAFESLKAP